ncbi:Spx/MgsR family RNA polymerase-binding regulatory protein [Facklamia lactis]|nr:Spx/MgsR family RNA polymerase-binding regulatory protein [Facklamia lactis]
MMKLKVYGLKQCSTTQKVIKALQNKGYLFDEIIDIREHPPTIEEISQALSLYPDNRRKIMNTSGALYRELGLKETIDQLSESEIMDLLAENGMLIKRPFITNGEKVSVGSRPEELNRTWP